jgi:lipopolysaccharide/colanic/teichoic acid biosynthesis glycosyltransferase
MSEFEGVSPSGGDRLPAPRSFARIADARGEEVGARGAEPASFAPARRVGAVVRLEGVARRHPTPIHPSPARPGLRAGAERINGSALKRLMDIAGASAGLLLLAPFLLLVALLIRLESPGPALFRQRRIGRGGVPFQIYKFRSMTVVEDGAVVVQASADDCRKTRLGDFLRRSCIDELPQLLNVLRGEMSLIGPRPHAAAHDAYYGSAILEYGSRHLVRPGIAGLAQVCGLRGATPTVECMAARVAKDLEYIDGWTLSSDVKILLQAVFEGPFHPAAF